jgi:UDP-GlcNAc3NAcA epimerase
MKIITIIGARPQFIKAAIVSKEFKKHSSIEEIVIHTGQHFDANMSDVFFEQMQITPAKYHLSISSLSHGAMTGRMLEQIETILSDEQPDWVLVYGDTNSTLAGALAASKLHIKVAHVEAGLRSFNMKMPEEQNRILTDQLSSILFCPTESAISNLKQEGFNNKKSKVVNVGDVMLDGVLCFKEFAKPPSISADFDFTAPFVLSTVHRAENTDDESRLKSIILALNKITETTMVILTRHPRTRNIISKLDIALNVTVIEPVGYLEMVYLIGHCQAIICDSGGLQKEAYFFEKPCITMRDETEWVELIDMSVNVLTGANKNTIVEAYNLMSTKVIERDPEHYGGGKACARIAEELINYGS